MIHRFLLGFCCLLLFACNPSKKLKTTDTLSDQHNHEDHQNLKSHPDHKDHHHTHDEIHFHFPYDINHPNEMFKLPKILDEISGLGFCRDTETLCAIQDENGLLFSIDINTGEVTKEMKFYEDGDYEGVEIVGDKTYVVKSNGTIYEISDMDKKEPTINKYKSFLNKKHNVEGLAYDAANNYLVLASKGYAVGNGDEKKVRSFYYFNLDTKEMRGIPLFYFHKDQVMEFIKEEVPEKNRHLFEEMDPGDDDFKLGPSGIAIHPITKNYFIISSKSKVLIVCDQKGNLIHFEKLDKKIHFQPEGIVFAPDGTLYLSTEVKKQEAAFIYKFEMITKI